MHHENIKTDMKSMNKYKDDNDDVLTILWLKVRMWNYYKETTGASYGCITVSWWIIA